MIERPDPDSLLAGPLGQWLAGQQALRDETRATVRKRRRLGLIAAVVVAVLAALFTGGDAEAMLWSGIVVGAAGWAWGEAARKKVTDAIKGEINRHVAQALGLDFALAVEPAEEWERACRFAMVPSFDKQAFEDCWSGTLGALPFRSYEAHCQEWQGSGKSRRLVTVFRGAVLTVGFTRRFHGTTLIEAHGRRRKWLVGGEKEEFEVEDERLQRCDMVDPTFEDRFTVWGTDAVEARYLVHPEYIERLIAVERAFAGKNLRALFCGGDLLILVETDNQFESGSLEAKDDRTLLAKTIDQFVALAELARRLNEAPRGNFQPAASA